MTEEKKQNANLPPRATGLLIIAVRNANPNGDPDRESDPRQRNHDGRGYITGVSFKRKLRDLVELKESKVWQVMSNRFELPPEQFCILESRDRGFVDVKDASDAWRRVLGLIEQGSETVANKYWDARVFGSTFLEKGEGEEPPPESGRNVAGDRKYIRSGVAHFGDAFSVAPIRIQRDTITKKASAQESKDRGMAPLASRIVEDGVYCMPFFINPSAGWKSGCTAKDIALLLCMIKHAYPETRSVARSHGIVEVIHAWYAEHEEDLCSFSEFDFIERLTPKRLGENPEKASVSNLPLRDQYKIPTELKELRGKLKSDKLYDLCVDLPKWCNQFKGENGDDE